MASLHEFLPQRFDSEYLVCFVFTAVAERVTLTDAVGDTRADAVAFHFPLPRIASIGEAATGGTISS